MEKQITFRLQGPNGDYIIGTDPIQLIQATFGCMEGGEGIDPDEKDALFGDMEEGEEYEYKLIVQKVYTEEDLENMDESDGDIH